MQAFILTTLVLFSTIATTSTARAQEPASPLSLEATQISHEDLIDVIHRDRNARLRWFYGWEIGYTTASITEFAVAGFAKEGSFKDQNEMWALTSAAGLARTLMFSIEPDHVDWNGNAALDAFTDKELYSRLRLQAKQEANIGGVFDHVANAAVATAAGAYLWGAENRPVNGIILTAVQLLIGEIQIWTAPKIALRTWKEISPDTDP